MLVTFKMCLSFFRRAWKNCRSTANQKENAAEESAFGFLCRAEMVTVGPKRNRIQAVALPHMIFNGTNGWKKVKPEDHPKVRIELRMEKTDYNHLILEWPRAGQFKTEGVTDAGAQCNLLGLKKFHQMGLTKKCFVPVKMKLKAVYGEGVNILGAVFLSETSQKVETGIFQASDLWLVAMFLR